MSIQKESSEDHISYTSRVNKICEDFKLNTLTSDQFKSLIFIIGLKSQQDDDIRTKLLYKIEEDDKITLEKITKEYSKLVKLKHDSKAVSKNDQHVNQIKKNAPKQNSKKKSSSETNTKPEDISCFRCGGKSHFSRGCAYLKHKCKDCNEVGHKEGFCDAIKSFKESSNKEQSKPKKNGGRSFQSRTIFNVNLVSNCERKFVDVLLKNVKMRLQLDTGSDITVISKTNWEKLDLKQQETIHHAKVASGAQLKLIGEFD